MNINILIFFFSQKYNLCELTLEMQLQIEKVKHTSVHYIYYSSYCHRLVLFSPSGQLGGGGGRLITKL